MDSQIHNLMMEKHHGQYMKLQQNLMSLFIFTQVCHIKKSEKKARQKKRDV